MKISGFSMVKNGGKLYYPVKESIMSILPLVDEFVIALGDCDKDDDTREQIESIGSDKIKIIDTVWDINKFSKGTEHAHQTDIAKEHCKGDWLFYLQADEVIHEKYLPVIEKRCRELLNDHEVEGILFKYLHFWGDYNHYQHAHKWYKHEIRIVRNRPDIHSWESAQSFRRIPDFDGKTYRGHPNTYKLKVAKIDAYVYHYGWVRPPMFMANKTKAIDTNHQGEEKAEKISSSRGHKIDYGPLGKIHKFKEVHPKVMEGQIKKFNWADELNYTKKYRPGEMKFKHDKLKYNIITFLENKIFHRGIFTFKNYVLLKK